MSSKRDVKVKDWKDEQHLLLIALNLVGISCDYVTVDLIHEVLKKMKEKGDKMDIHDAVKIRTQHDKKWSEYFDSKNNENQ
jgi:hypothetical protein